MTVHFSFKKILFCVLLVSGYRICAQDIILKHDGTEINAKILEVGSGEIKFKRFEYQAGPTVVVSKSEVFSIKYEDGKKVVFEETSIPSEPSTFTVKNPNVNGIITHKDGDEIDAKILEIGEKEIKYKRKNYLNGPTISLAKCDIFCITYEDGKKETFDAKNSDSNSAVDNSNIQFYNGENLKVAGLYIPKNETQKTRFSSVHTDSEKDLSTFPNVTIMFSGQSGLKCYDDKKCFDLEKKYKSSIANLMEEKHANNYFLANFYNYNLGAPEVFSNSLLLEYSFLMAGYSWTKKDRDQHPDYVVYQLNIVTPSGQKVRTYYQYVYLHSVLYMSAKQALESKDMIYDVFMLCTMNYAFSSLLNKFLNDKYGQASLGKYMEKQKNAVPEKHFSEFAKAQTRLFEILQNKNILVQELSGMGVQIEGISDGKTLINAGMAQTAIRLMDPASKFANYSNLAQAGIGLANLFAANHERKKLEEKQALVNKLKSAYNKLVFEEESISRNLNPELVNSPAIELFPANPELNKAAENYLADIKQKTAAANNNINAEFSQTTQDFMNLTKEIQRQEQQKAAEQAAKNNTNATANGGGTYNAAAAKQCSDRSQNEWRNSPLHQKFDQSSVTTFSQADAEELKGLLAEITLRNCSAFLPPNEIAMLTSMKNQCYQTAAQLRNGGVKVEYSTPKNYQPNQGQTGETQGAGRCWCGRGPVGHVAH